jgi:pilus assembly protein FimV
MESPLLIPGAAVLVALLAGLGVYRLRGSMRKKAGETSFLESRLQPDSFFGASGGQRVDTKDGSASAAGTSSVSSSYSLSQLDAIGDVDPVAEADVYLAYGRDLQAEEILKEAMRSTPDRLAIRIKLLEVYAKRRDMKGFELLATQVHAITGGQGEDWARAQALGRDLESDNPLYQPGGAPSPVLDEGGRAVELLEATTRPHTAIPSQEAFIPAADAASLDDGVDLDLDLDLDSPTSQPSAVETTRPLHTDVDIPADTLGMSRPGDEKTMPMPKVQAQAPAPAAIESLDFDLGDYEPHPKTISQVPKTVAVPRPMADIPRTVSDVPTTRGEPRIGATSELPNDDFGNFTLPASALDTPESGDPLVRKLELAEEFRQIGDVEGARDLLEEVVAKADGALKAKAQGMLNGLG